MNDIVYASHVLCFYFCSLFSESMLKVIQKNGGQFSDWAEFLYKDLVVTLLQELPSVPLEGKSMQTALIKAYKKQLERCQQLHSF